MARVLPAPEAGTVDALGVLLAEVVPTEPLVVVGATVGAAVVALV